MEGLREVVQFYFTLGSSQREILQFLKAIDGVHISMRTLQRLLKEAKLYRRKFRSDLLEVALFVQSHLNSHGKLHGYKLMHLKCIQTGFVVTQETVRMLLHILDPEGVAIRKRGRLRRRIYENPGPNFFWHVDSYDKLKPYGICINGAIDGFSRQIIWMHAFCTNSDPKLIAGYFIEEVQCRMGCPARLRCDLGTENGHLEQMQRFLRYGHTDEFASRCFVYGSSNHNQRIESWWCFLRKQHAQFWMNQFQSLKQNDLFCGDLLDKALAQFCCMRIIQQELDHLVTLWNAHRIRSSRYGVVPSGRPILMYTIPETFARVDKLQSVSHQQIEACRQECRFKGLYPCDETVFELCCLIMEEDNVGPPKTPQQCLQLYLYLRDQIRNGL